MEITEYQEKLAEVRKEIDEIDRKLLPLFLKRMQCSEKVAALKREAGAPVLNASLPLCRASCIKPTHAASSRWPDA